MADLTKYSKGKRMVPEDLIKKLENLEETTYTAGDNITIEDGVISATDTTYTAGEGITIEDGVISATGGSETKYYIHDITLTHSSSSGFIKLNKIENTSQTPITFTDIYNSIVNDNKIYGCYGLLTPNSGGFRIATLISNAHNSTGPVIYSYGMNSSDQTSVSWQAFSQQYITVVDTITER